MPVHDNASIIVELSLLSMFVPRSITRRSFPLRVRDRSPGTINKKQRQAR